MSPPGITRLTKNKLWKVKCILKNKCSWNSYDLLEFQEHLYSRALFNLHNFQKCSLKIVVIKFLKIQWKKDTSNFSKILVKYLWWSSLFVNLPTAYSFTVVFQGFSLLFYFFLGNTFEWLLNANKKRVLIEISKS